MSRSVSTSLRSLSLPWLLFAGHSKVVQEAHIAASAG